MKTTADVKNLLRAICAVCDIASDEESGVLEIWDGNIDTIEQRVERLEFFAEDEGITGFGKELFAAAYHIIGALREIEAN